MFAAFLSIALLQASPASPGAVAGSFPGSFNVEPTVDGIRLVAHEGGIPVEISNLKIGPVSDVLRHGTTLYAALVAGGVAIVDLRTPGAPVVVGHLVEGRVVQQLAHQGNNVLVAIFPERDTAAFSLSEPLRPVAIDFAIRDFVPQTKGHGRVLGVRDGTVVIEGGLAAGFREGEHVAILSRRLPNPSDAATRAAGLPKEGTRTAVVALSRVEADRSLGQLGRGDGAEVGDDVEATDEDLSSSLFLPSQAPFSWRLWVTLRPFFDTNTSSQSAGVVMDAMAAYYFQKVPLRIEAGLQPLGFAGGALKEHNPLAAIADVAVTGTYFEFGLGSGVFALASTCTGNAFECTSAGSATGPLLVQTLRLGAIDGGNLIWSTAVGVVPNQGFQILSMRGEANIPILTRFSLYAGGGGGLGYFYADFGARAYVNGLGDPGTVILSAGIGGAGLSDNAGEFLAGPALTLGAELRL